MAGVAMTDPAHIEECIASLPEDVQSILAAQLLGSRVRAASACQ